MIVMWNMVWECRDLLYDNTKSEGLGMRGIVFAIKLII
jgi:hypothetical protein